MLPNSTLRLEVSKIAPNYKTPWATGAPSASSATVTVLSYEGNIYLVTNAHAVTHTSYLKVKLNKNSTELPVKVVWVDSVLDLAILATTGDLAVSADELLKKEMTPLEIIPTFQKQGTAVSAYGYAAGGRSLSFTRGTISRVELSTMACSGEIAITIQTSAAINPGNSGGPITCRMPDGTEKCIGIVAQGAPMLQNTGYFIPACTVIATIERYLQFGSLRNIGLINSCTAPAMSFVWQPLKNKELRQSLGLPKTALGEELTGIRVSNIHRSSCAYGIMQTGDIIQEIDGTPIQSNGQVEIEGLEHPIGFNFLVLQKKFLSTLNITIQRAKPGSLELEKLVLAVRLNKQIGQYIDGPKYAEPLKYHIQPCGKAGAFIFVRYTRPLSSMINQGTNAGTPWFSSGLSNMYKKDVSEIVVLHSIIVSEETDGYESLPIVQGAACSSHRVTTVTAMTTSADGKIVTGEDVNIDSLYDLVTAFEDASKTYIVTFANKMVMVIAPQHKEAKINLQRSHHISFFTSPTIAKINPSLLIEQISKLGERDDNKFDFLKHVDTVVTSDCVVIDAQSVIETVIPEEEEEELEEETSDAAGMKHAHD